MEKHWTVRRCSFYQWEVPTHRCESIHCEHMVVLDGHHMFVIEHPTNLNDSIEGYLVFYRHLMVLQKCDREDSRTLFVSTILNFQLAMTLLDEDLDKSKFKHLVVK